MRKLLFLTAFVASCAGASAAGVVPIGVIGPGGPGGPQTTTVMAGDMVEMDGTVAFGVSSVEFEVVNSSGSTVYQGSANPDITGHVGFSFFPLYDGTYTVTAYPVVNGVRGEAQTVLITNSVRPDASGYITGGGWYSQDGYKDTFGFVAQVLGNGSVRGSLEFQDHGGMNFRSTSVDWVYAPSPTEGYFAGYTKLNGAGNYRFFVHVFDRGEPGTNDEVNLWVYDSVGSPIFTYTNLLTKGNVQIHKR